MKRRRLMIGLGVVTIGSATTALTGATFQNRVSPTADFRVNVEGDLLAQKGEDFPSSPSEPSNTPSSLGVEDPTYYTSGSTGGTVFNELNDEGGPAAVADQESNDALHIGLALPYSTITDEGTPVEFHFPKFIQLVNNTASDKSAAVGWDSDGGSIDDPSSDNQHGFETDPATGPAAVSPSGGDDQLSFTEVAAMFQFRDENDLMISPNPGTDQNSIGEADGSADVPAGETKQIDLMVRIGGNIQTKIENFVSNNNLQTTGNPMSLVDAIYIGAHST